MECHENVIAAGRKTSGVVWFMRLP